MAKVKAEGHLSEVNDLPDGVEIIIPVETHKVLFAFLGIIFLALFLTFLKDIFALIVLIMTLKGEIFFIISETFSLFLFGLASLFLFLWLVWCIKGKYIIRTDGIELQSKNNFLLFLSRPKEYNVADIVNLRVSAMRDSDATDAFDYTKCSIAFDYGRKAIRVAHGLDEAEANYVVNTLKSRYNSLKS